MYYHLLLSVLPIVTSQLCEHPQHQHYTCQNNTLACPGDEKCTFLEHCPAVASLMNRNELSAHRFDQSYGRDKLCDFCDTTNITKCIRLRLFEKPNTLTGEIKYSCNGVIINERTILTTATCALAKSERYKLCSVLIGEYNTESDPDCNKLFCGHKISSHDISYVIKHPGYDAASYSNNVALLRLKKAIDFTATAQPICFVPEDRYISLGSTCTVIGWGKLSDQKTQPMTQQSLQLKLVSKQQCSDYLNQGLSVELCAIGNCEPCSGYSGSPMLYKYADIYFLVGILSYGSSCDSTTIFPSAFVNVQRYARWILENC